MSWTMWHINGPGFDCATASNDALKAFFKNHAEALWKAYLGKSDIMRALAELEIEEQNGEFEPDQWQDEVRAFSDNFSIAGFVVAIMTEETGIRFSCPGYTDDGEDCVVFLDASPWEYNETERALTQDSLYSIMKKYAGELGVKFNPDFDLIYAG